MESFGERLRTVRTQRHLTQRDLEKMTGLNNTAISLLETGKREPTLKTSIRLADALHLSLDWLTGRAPPRDQGAEPLTATTSNRNGGCVCPCAPHQ